MTELGPRSQVVDLDDHRAVEVEVARQIDHFHKLTGDAPTHLDSHQHLHRNEPAKSVIVRAASSIDVPVRGYHPSITHRGDFYGQDGRGHPYPECISVEAFERIVSSLSPGWTELGCHPGELDGSSEGVYQDERAVELAVLCDERAGAGPRSPRRRAVLVPSVRPDMTAPTIVVAGGLAERAGLGGHAWMFLQYLLGFRRLGYEVLFVDRLEPSWLSDEESQPGVPERSAAMEQLRSIMGAVSPPVTHAVLVDGGARSVGVERRDLVERVRRSVMVLDVMGYLDDEELMDVAPLTVFLDIDPGFPQMWRMLGWADVLGLRDVRIGRRPHRSGGLRHPDLWHRLAGDAVRWSSSTSGLRKAIRAAVITTVATWRGPFGSVEYEGRIYGLRVDEFRDFIELPTLTGIGVELARHRCRLLTRPLAPGAYSGPSSTLHV